MPRLAAFMLRSRLVTLLGSIALVALFASQAAAGPSFVYALQQVTENVSQIHGFRLDLVSGALTPLPGFPVATGGKGGGGVKSEAMAHANGRLYVINNESDTLSAFSVNRTTGALTALPFSPIVLGAGWWDCVAVHPSGSPVVAGNAEGGLSSFVITATTATAAAGSPFATGGALPYSCAFSRDGSVVYTGGTSSSPLIAGFSVAAGTGVLTPLPGSPFDSGGGVPRGYAIDRSGRLFAVTFATGHLRVFTTAAGVPTAVTGNPFLSGLLSAGHGVLHPRGFYMAAAHGGGHKVGVYRIDGTGSATTLTAVPGSPFLAGGTLTTALAITLDGGLLVAANGLTRNLTVFQVNSTTGGLTSLGVQPPNTLGTTGQITGLAFVPPPALGDFNADGTADLLWRNKVNGQDVGWLLNGSTATSAAFLPTIADTNWEVKGVGDFDANGKADVIWRNKISGQNIAWLMDGLTVASSAFLPLIADMNWEITGVGDFDADGKADVIWRNKVTGETIAWLMNGTTVMLSAFVSTLADTNWEIKGVGDVEGNGKADVVWRHKVTGQGIVWLMNGASVSISGFLPTVTDTNWEIKGVGDLDGAGKADLVMRNKVTGMNVAWLMNGTTVASAHLLATVDTSWEIKAVRDVDGDGHADVVWRNKVTGLNVAWLMNGVTIKATGFLPAIFDLNWEIVSP